VVYYFEFERPGLEKPWQENRDKIEEYFNYGFNEESFKIYQQKVKKFSENHLQELKGSKEFKERVLDDNRAKEHHPINFYLPHEFGGAGQPVR